MKPKHGAPNVVLSVKAPERPRGIDIPRIRPVEGWGGTGQGGGFSKLAVPGKSTWNLEPPQKNLDLELGFVLFFTDFYQFVNDHFLEKTVFFLNWFSKHRTSKSKTTILCWLSIGWFQISLHRTWLESTISIHFTLVVMGNSRKGPNPLGDWMATGVWGFQADGRFHVKKRWTFLQGGEILGGGNSKICCFQPYLRRWSNLTNIFQMGWNHQLEFLCVFFSRGVWEQLCSPSIRNWYQLWLVCYSIQFLREDWPKRPPCAIVLDLPPHPVTVANEGL